MKPGFASFSCGDLHFLIFENSGSKHAWFALPIAEGTFGWIPMRGGMGILVLVWLTFRLYLAEMGYPLSHAVCGSLSPVGE